MKLFLQTLLCFVFVAAVFGQDGYDRRRRIRPEHRQRRPVQRPPYPSNVDAFDSTFGQFNALDSLRNGGMPEEIRRIIGSTVSGESLVGGINGLPRHGGTLNDNGLVNGWGARSEQPANPAVNMWSDPLNGARFPLDYSGGELVYDPAAHAYTEVRKDTAIGHQNEHVGHNTVGTSQRGTVNTGHVGFTPPEAIAHNIQTATLGADAVAGHNRARSSGFPLAGVGFIDPTGPVATQIGHEITRGRNRAVVDPFEPVDHGVGRRRHVAPGMDIFGQGSMMVDRQPVRQAFQQITGYGRRQRH